VASIGKVSDTLHRTLLSLTTVQEEQIRKIAHLTAMQDEGSKAIKMLIDGHASMAETLHNLGKQMNAIQELGVARSTDTPASSEKGEELMWAGHTPRELQAWDLGLIDCWETVTPQDPDRLFWESTFIFARVAGDIWNELKQKSHHIATVGFKPLGTVARIEGVLKLWLRHGKPRPPKHISKGWVPIQEAWLKVRETMKFDVGMEALFEAILLSVDYETGKSGKIAVFQLRGMTKDESIAMQPLLAGQAIGGDTAGVHSFLWIRANPKAGSTPHKMTPDGVVEGENWDAGKCEFKDTKNASSSGWASSKDKKWRNSDAGW
jgi:hypothetical protein